MESYNIVLVKLDSPVEVHSSVLISVYFFKFINVSASRGNSGITIFKQVYRN